VRIAVSSGKGGTGKTTVAVNLAGLMAESSGNICYVDCDVEEPNGHLFLKPAIDKEWPAVLPVPVVDEETCDYCGECKKICQYNAITVIAENILVFPELCHGCGGCTRVCPREAITENPRAVGMVMAGNSSKVKFISGKLNIGEPLATTVIRAVKSAIGNESDILIDAPPGTSCPVVEAINGSDLVLLVSEPTPFGLNDLKLAVETVRKLDLDFGVVINRSDIGNDSVRQYCLEESIPIIAEIPNDRKIAELYSRGELLYEAHPGFRERLKDISDWIDQFKKARKRMEYENSDAHSRR
jgi:MinD superfamily P-loop ATPase